MNRSRALGMVVLVVSLLWGCSAVAQFGDLMRKAEKKAEERAAKGKKKDANNSDQGSQPAASDNNKSNGTANGDETKPAATANSGSEQPSTPTDANGQPVLTSVPIDFVPGEKTVFYDDFSDMAPDEPPPHWKVREGTVDLRMNGKIRELYAENGVHLTSQPVAIPTNFTFQLLWTGKGEMDWYFRDKDNNNVLEAMVRGEPDGHTVNTTISGPDGELGSGTTSIDTTQPVEFDLWAQQGRVRAYVAGKRLVDVNQVKFSPMTSVYVDDARYRPNGIRSVRIAESAPDPGSVLAATGKYVTHGINFDTDSDRLKPESAPVIKQIAAALIKNPALKLEIDGYTDSVGDAAHNLDLSKRRAGAVRSVLVSQFGIDASRLSSNGFGADKPVASNDTPDGRAQNRRVEFVKQ